MRSLLKKSRYGATLVELVIVIGVALMVTVGLMVLTNNSFKSLWTLKGRLELTDQASEAMHWIGQDFRNAKASSMGNQAQNPGFEEPMSRTSPTGRVGEFSPQ